MPRHIGPIIFKQKSTTTMKSPKKIVAYIKRLAIIAAVCFACTIALHYLFTWIDSQYVIELRYAKHCILAVLGAFVLLEMVVARLKSESKLHKALSICRRIAFSSNVLFFGYLLIFGCNECDKWLTFLSLSIGTAIMLEVDRYLESNTNNE